MNFQSGEESTQSIWEIDSFVCTITIKMLTCFLIVSSLSVFRSFLCAFLRFGLLSSDWRLTAFEESFDVKSSLVDTLRPRGTTASDLCNKILKKNSVYSIKFFLLWYWGIVSSCRTHVTFARLTWYNLWIFISIQFAPGLHWSTVSDIFRHRCHLFSYIAN